MTTGFLQQAQAQKEGFFNHFHSNRANLCGFNAGLKLFNGIWLTAATDFEELQDLQRPQLAVYEFGLRLNFNRKENISNYLNKEVPDPSLLSFSHKTRQPL